MFEIVIADLARSDDASALVRLLVLYALDPAGGGQPLTNYVKENLATALAARSDVIIVFAKTNGEAVGMVICIEGFSTFACRPLLNIHDVIVMPAYRGRGISKLMFDRVEQIARLRGCCKLTLEVLSGNQPARSAYASFGFTNYQLDPQLGDALFLQKKLDEV